MSGRLRVLLFGRYADTEFGGIERHVRSLVDAMRDDVEFVNLVEDRGLPLDSHWPCQVVSSRAIAVVASLAICPGMPWTARRLDRKSNFHIAHLHLPDPMSHLAAAMLPPDVRIVVTWHSDIVRQKWIYGSYRPFLRKLMQRVAVVIAPTPAHFSSMPQLAELTPQSKRAVVPFGFELSSFQQPHPLAADLRQRFGERVVFALGRHVYYKGFEYLIAAMAKVPLARLVLGESGPLTEQLKALAGQAGVADRVHFAGRIRDDELPAYYQACDVFCLPAVELSEAFGIVQVEAMAAGKPVVCTQLGNGVNWVNQEGVTGLSVPARNEGALAAALSRLLDDAALRAEMGEHAARRARESFSLAALREGTRRVYERARSFT